jgi:urease accessory protein
MIRFDRRVTVAPEHNPTISLTSEQRARARMRAVLSDGREAGILLPRGAPLRDGDGLGSADGLAVRVCAAPEILSRVESDDALALARVCYHLGNRHVALQIEPHRLSWLHDHVLDAMVEGLGLRVQRVTAPFEPETGAYGGHGSHGHVAHHHDP